MTNISESSENIAYCVVFVVKVTASERAVSTETTGGSMDIAPTRGGNKWPAEEARARDQQSADLPAGEKSTPSHDAEGGRKMEEETDGDAAARRGDLELCKRMEVSKGLQDLSRDGRKAQGCDLSTG